MLESIFKQLSELFKCAHHYDTKIYSGAAQLICSTARKLSGRLNSMP
jgi:hypothetical protein